MKIFISGISGTGMGPLALMAKDAGFEVLGTDLKAGAILPELLKAGIEVKIGEQDGEFLREKLADGVDWFVHTSAVKEEHPELKLAREAGVKVSKRDDFTAFLVGKLGLKMVAVAGTHGKTTTTAMIVWAGLKLGLPISYIVGTTLNFAAAGKYAAGDQFFVYEADEYDRNFLKFYPWLAVIPSVSYDHPDIYPTREEYAAAFDQFRAQSEMVLEGESSADFEFKLAGAARRHDAELAARAILAMAPEVPVRQIIEILNEFPGVGRRFERISDGFYTDYAHHPEEILATLDVAREEAERLGLAGVVAVYQPHQNTRQHEVFSGYKPIFREANHVFWLPTFLTRENPELKVLAPADFIKSLEEPEKAEPAEMDERLVEKLKEYRKKGVLILLMTAGPADEWFRKNFGD